MKFSITFTNEFTVIVEGETREEVEEAAKAAADDGLRDWDTNYDWGFHVTPLRAGATNEPDMGVLEGELVHIDDLPAKEST